MAKINPAQIALLKEMQPEFNFQERKIQPSLESMGGDFLEETNGKGCYHIIIIIIIVRVKQPICLLPVLANETADHVRPVCGY
jgi:hypothetical protein